MIHTANFYLENMIDLVEEDLDSRIVQYLNQSPENGEFRFRLRARHSILADNDDLMLPQMEANGTWQSTC